MVRVTAPFSPHRLRGHRHGSGLSVEKVAARAGCAVLDWLEYETGRAEPPATLVPKLAAALGIAAAELRPQSGDPIDDYVVAVASYARPLTQEDLAPVAAMIRARRRGRVATAAS